MLLANADDFGLTPGINRSIIELREARALSSATLMATATFFDDAVRLAHDHPTLEVGCHILLVDAAPALPPEQIPSLVTSGGQLRPTLAPLVRDLYTGRIRPAEIEAEAIAQIRRLQAAGLRVSHIDTHKHTHIFPRVLAPLLRAACACGIPAIRNPFEPDWALRVTRGISPIRRLAVHALGSQHRAFLRLVARSGLATTAGTIGVLATGTAGSDAVRTTLLTLIDAMPQSAAAWELVCHPGYPDQHLDQVRTRLRGSRAQEHAALLELLPKVPLATWHHLSTGL